MGSAILFLDSTNCFLCKVLVVHTKCCINFQLKGLLSTECDVMYECKVCRNIFRSLANFISHKRVYCKEKFSSSVHGHFVKETSVVSIDFIQIQPTSLQENWECRLNF